MPGAIRRYLADDHVRIEGYLAQATANPAALDMEAYANFRKGLIRHIGLEEKILFPVLTLRSGAGEIPGLDRLHLDHGAIVALLVPPPSPSVLAALRSILRGHDALEEGDDGVYARADAIEAPEAQQVLERLVSSPEVPLLPHNDRPDILEATRRALARAGYSFALEP